MYTFAASLSGRQYGINIQNYGLAKTCHNLPNQPFSTQATFPYEFHTAPTTILIVDVNE